MHSQCPNWLNPITKPSQSGYACQIPDVHVNIYRLSLIESNHIYQPINLRCGKVLICFVNAHSIPCKILKYHLTFIVINLSYTLNSSKQSHVWSKVMLINGFIFNFICCSSVVVCLHFLPIMKSIVWFLSK